MSIIVNYILSLLLLPGFILESTDEQSHKKHLVIVNHPAFGEEDSNEFYLWELRDDDNKIDGYFLDAESVICVDHSCKIVPVRIFWNALGNYQKYELPNGVILEKKEGEPFLPEDYERLQEILMDKSSPYKDLSYYAITHEKIVGEGEVDGITGATPIILDETKTVEGAAWTCYTLWHWANGDIIQEMQRITGAACSTEELLYHLRSTDQSQQLFALDELIERKDYGPQLVKEVINQGSRENLAPESFKKIIVYLEQAPSFYYYQSIKILLEVSSKNQRIQLLKSILKYNSAPSEGYFDHFWEKLIQANDYQEINLFLSILEQKKASTPALIQKMLPLLQKEYSIINRRVYWFLSEFKLSDAQQQILKIYYEKNANYL